MMTQVPEPPCGFSGQRQVRRDLYIALSSIHFLHSARQSKGAGPENQPC